MFTPYMIDIEASNLGKGSYPIEVGFVNDQQKTFCTLIKPVEDWQHWDKEAEALHKIPRALLLERGLGVSEVAKWRNENLRSQTVYSDGCANDMCWLWKLFEEAELSQLFKVESILTLLTEAEKESWTPTYQQVQEALALERHRAITDALVIQKTYLQIKCASSLTA